MRLFPNYIDAVAFVGGYPYLIPTGFGRPRRGMATELRHPVGVTLGDDKFYSEEESVLPNIHSHERCVICPHHTVIAKIFPPNLRG